MKVLDYKKYIAALDAYIKHKERDVKSSAMHGYYDKAAMLHNQIDGLKKARRIATLGDHIVSSDAKTKHVEAILSCGGEGKVK